MWFERVISLDCENYEIFKDRRSLPYLVTYTFNYSILWFGDFCYLLSYLYHQGFFSLNMEALGHWPTCTDGSLLGYTIKFYLYKLHWGIFKIQKLSLFLGFFSIVHIPWRLKPFCSDWRNFKLSPKVLRLLKYMY